MATLVVVALTTFVVAVLTTELTRRVVLRRNVLAYPNERSSHSVATPTAGGIGLVVPIAMGCFLFLPGDGLAWTVLFSTVAVALVSLVDDVVEVRRTIRFAVHVLASAACVVVGLGLTGVVAVVTTLAFAWALNLYNFMDGIDGYAASQALAFGLGVLVFLPWASELALVAGVITASSAGFLCFNWAPARIFMGDVGSGFLGLTLAVVAVVLARQGDVALTVSLILLAAFWVDASYTLTVRVFTGQRFTSPHRSHLYQILSRRYGHGMTVSAFWVFFLLWLLPWSWFVDVAPDWRFPGVAVAIAPLVIACAIAGAGRREIGFEA